MQKWIGLNMINWPLLILTVMNLSAFYWGVLKFFKDRGSVDKRELRILQASTILTWICCVFGLVQFPVDGARLYFATLVELLAGLLFFFSVRAAMKIQLSLVFSKDAPTKLLNFGPYRWIRHPFYTSYLLCYFGASLGSDFLATHACTILMIIVYVRAARFEEKKFEESTLADEYRKYRSQAGAFFPKVLRR